MLLEQVMAFTAYCPVLAGTILTGIYTPGQTLLSFI